MPNTSYDAYASHVGSPRTLTVKGALSPQEGRTATRVDVTYPAKET